VNARANVDPYDRPGRRLTSFRKSIPCSCHYQTGTPSIQRLRRCRSSHQNSGVGVEYGKKRLCLDDVSGGEQNRGNESELDGVKPVAIVFNCGKACLLFELAGSANRCIRIIVFMV